MKWLSGIFILSLIFISSSVYATDITSELEQLERQMNPAVVNNVVSTGKRQIELPKFNLITHLWFNKDVCRVTQWEDSHILKANGSMYAVDIACWAEVIIVAPNYLYWDYQYTVAKVGRDKYLWDYVTIDFPMEWWAVWTLVYGHTSTPLKVWDKLKAWELLWKYSPSGKTTWPHTHIELWRWGKNITFDLMEENAKSLRLRVQRWRASYADFPTTVWVVKETVYWTVAELATQLIQKFEWIKLKAYYDWRKGKNPCSIWHWTYANSCSEVITKEEADRRFYVALQKRINTVNADHPNLNNYQKSALVSLLYNCPSWYRTVTNKWINRSNWMTCVTAQWKYLRWLAKRRAAEWEWYNTPVK